MDIRELRDADATGYFDLRVQAEQEYPEFAGFNAERELAAGRAGIIRLLASYAEEGTVVFGAFEHHTLVGVVALSRRLSHKYRHKAFLWGMYVLPDFRGSGVARTLMKAATAWAMDIPEVVAISLQVTVTNQRAQHFYQRCGFTVFGTENRSLFVAGRFHDVRYMELDLQRVPPYTDH